ncbi:MAG: hypothetical protein IJ840_09005 [Bacteroidales bacterium]|nr:hypothetical protein [Bacteroidales bacterium]
MRKLVYITIAVCLLLACRVGAPENGSIDLATIRDSWRGKTIGTKNLGESPTVIQLLRAFNEVWPSAAADSLLEYAGDKLYVSEDDVFVDCEDMFFAWYDHGDTGSQRIGVRNYSRQNGHTLFAVLLEQVNPEEILFCCFFDYDPSTGLMAPEDEPYAGFKPQHDGSIISYWLTENDYDQDIIIVETSPDDSYPTLYHHYTFDGMRHDFSGSSEEYIYPEYEEDYDPLPESAVLRAESDHYRIYTTVARPASEEDPEVLALWVKGRGEDEETRRICTTYAYAEPKWASMTEGNAIPVSIDSGDIACAENIIPIPWDPDKFYIDGCPDARNVWSYILDFSDIDDVKALQFPSTEGFLSFDIPGKRIHLGAYRYHAEGGRYSIEQVYTIDGKKVSEKIISPAIAGDSGRCPGHQGRHGLV